MLQARAYLKTGTLSSSATLRICDDMKSQSYKGIHPPTRLTTDSSGLRLYKTANNDMEERQLFERIYPKLNLYGTILNVVPIEKGLTKIKN